MLYDFNRLDQALTKMGFPQIKGKKGFHVVKGIDFEQAFKSNEVLFEDDGIYVISKGQKLRGYMFIQEAFITYDGGPPKFPKFHLVKCRIIQEFIDQGRFHQRYEVSNSDVNDLVDRQTKREYKNIKLEICKYCQNSILASVTTTDNFYALFVKDSVLNSKVEVDIHGYVRGKEKISKTYREKMQYTCDICKVKSREAMHNRFWHVHHKDGDKLNNLETNLQCLCICCHSNMDDRHQDNFKKSSVVHEMRTFLELYKDDLSRLGNKKCLKHLNILSV